MVYNTATQEEENEEENTLVWWNISSCPIPPGFDPRQVAPRIVSALKNFGVSGPVTITAIGRLTDNPNAPDNNVLRELSSTGMALIHAEELQTDLYDWIEKNPPPANIMLISGPTELESLARTLYSLLNDGYPIFVAYPERRPAPDWLWESFLCGVHKEWLWTSLLSDDNADNKQLTTRLVHQDNCSEKGESPWSCSPCDFAGQSFEDFTTHLKSEEHTHSAVDSVVGAPKHNPKMVDIAKFHQSKEEEENEEENTLVWWNISSCPIPPGFDPRQVGPRIVSALKNYGVSGPVTITAIGRLTHNPNAPDNNVLRELSSTGISLIHAKELQTDLFYWIEKNPPPANIMLISGPTELESLARTLYSLLNDGYPILVAYPERRPAPDWLWESFLCGVHKEWLWTSLLSDDNADNKQLTTRLVHQDNCSEKGESHWSCSPCDFAGQSFEDFTTHLKSEEHADFAVDSVVGAPKHNPKMLDIAKFHQSKTMSKKRKIGEVEVEEDTEVEVEIDDRKEAEVEEERRTAC